MTENANPLHRVWSAVQREPLLLFLILGAALYGAWASLAPADVETVQIETAALRAIETQEEELRGRPLTDEERETLREGYIDDEVLLREALGRGLQWSDSRVRQRLTRIMRGALIENVADPSVAQLQAYFRDNIDRFSTPETTTLDQVIFPWGDEVTEEELATTLAKLRAGANPVEFGSTTMTAARHLTRRSRRELVGRFGAGFADELERLPVGEWSGPVESVQGVHLVRVVERHAPEVAEFENVESYLRQDWLMFRTRELQQARVDAIRERYRIEYVDE